MSIAAPLIAMMTAGPCISDRVENTAKPTGGATLVRAPMSPNTLPCIEGSMATRSAIKMIVVLKEKRKPTRRISGNAANVEDICDMAMNIGPMRIMLPMIHFPLPFNRLSSLIIRMEPTT